MLLPLRFVAQATQNWRNTKNPLAERLGFFVWSPTALGSERGEQPLSNGLRHPASASRLEQHSRLAGRCPNNSSLFPPLAAVVVVALRGGWSPEAGRGVPTPPSLPLDSTHPAMQQLRPPPAAETGSSCWGSGQQDASAAQGTKRMLGAATRRQGLLALDKPKEEVEAQKS